MRGLIARGLAAAGVYAATGFTMFLMLTLMFQSYGG